MEQKKSITDNTKINGQKVFEAFLLFTDMREQDAGAWRQLCQNSAEELQKRMKKSAGVAGNTERLRSAAAACAYCDYLLKTGEKECESNAWEIRDYFMLQIADLLAV